MWALHGNSRALQRGQWNGIGPLPQSISSFLSASPGTLSEIPPVFSLPPPSSHPSFSFLFFYPSTPFQPLQLCSCCFLHQNSFPSFSFLIKTHPSMLSSNVTPSGEPSHCPPQAELTSLPDLQIIQISHFSLFGSGLASHSGCPTTQHHTAHMVCL